MADELDAVGIQYEAEDDVRAVVAAEVAMNSAPEVIREQDKLKKMKTKLQEMEATFDVLLSKSPDDPGQGSAYDFKVKQMKRQLEMQVTQITQQGRVIERAKQQAKQKALQQEQIEKARAVLQAERARAEDAMSAGANAVTSRDQLQLGASIVAGGGVGAAQPHTIHHHHRAHRTTRTGGGGGNTASNNVSVNPNHVRGVGATETAAVEDYRGGEVLSSVNNVTIKALGTKGKKVRRADDGDESLFVARQREERKRKRKERRQKEKEALLAARREQGEEIDSDEEDSTSSDDNDAYLDESDDDDDVNLFQLVPGWFIDNAVFQALLPYQQTGIRWLIGLTSRRTGGILGDEMGLGKTVQIAAFLNCLVHSNVLRGPCLIVAPLTVLHQWVAEIHKWCPKVRVVVFHSSGSATTSKQDQINSVKDTPAVMLTSYAALHQQNALLQNANFQFLILDEGHKISNPEASVTIAAKSFYTPHKIVLTGSPIQNTLKELWCLFDFVSPSLLGYQQKFVEEFEEPIAASRNPRATELQIQTAIECAKALRAHIAPYMLRRLKKDVNAMLPAKHERVVRCHLTDEQLKEYINVLRSPEVQEYLMKSNQAKMNAGRLDRNHRGADGGLVSGMNRSGVSDGMTYRAYKILGQLRMICNHTDIYQLKQDDMDEGGTGKNISFRSNKAVDLKGSSKLTTLAKLLVRWKENGHKALIFSQTRMMLDIIENLVEQCNYRYIRMDGNTPTKHRSVLIDKFNEDDTIVVAILTTKVGGLGVNLTGADRVVIFDPDWNPVTDEQARERAWRIGQRREVCVYRMITAGTVEEHILHRQLAKTYVTDKVLKDPTLQRFFTVNQLSDAFYLGAEYAGRVPPEASSLIVAGNKAGNVVAEIDEEMLREEGEDNLAAPHVKTEGGAGGGGGPRVKTETKVKQELPEAQFVAMPGSGSGNANGNGGGGGGGAAQGGANPNAQTSLLSTLVDEGEDAVRDENNAMMFYQNDTGLVRRMASNNAQQVIGRAVSTTEPIIERNLTIKIERKESRAPANGGSSKGRSKKK